MPSCFMAACALEVHHRQQNVACWDGIPVSFPVLPISAPMQELCLLFGPPVHAVPALQVGAVWHLACQRTWPMATSA